MTLNNILIVFNPVAGHRYPRSFKKFVLKSCQKYLPQTDFDWLETKPGLATQFKKQGLKKYQRLIAIGGDGTLKDIADFLLKNKLKVPLAIIPQGSANILASSLNIPLATEAALKTACLGQEKMMDVGLLNKKHYFLICLSLGFWSKVVSDTSRGLKIKLGFLAYLLTYLKQQRANHITYKFTIDGKKYQTNGNTLVVANALSLFKLKPKKPIDFYDGRFDLMVLKNKTLWGFIIMCLFAFFNKRYLPNLFLSEGKKIIIEPSLIDYQIIQIDGETIKVKKLKIEIVPHQLRIITD